MKYVKICDFMNLINRGKQGPNSIATRRMSFHYISTSSVEPSPPPPQAIKRIELTPWDLQLLAHQYNQRGLLFIKPKQQQQEQGDDDNGSCLVLINHLKTTFSQALHHFYPLAGRLATTTDSTTNTTTVFINCNNAGAEFIHAKAEITIAEFVNPTCVPQVVLNSLFPLNGVLNYNGVSQPLISVQVTEIIDGIFIGVSMNHGVCDGQSFWHFFNSWSEISRSGGSLLNHQSHVSIPRPPFLKRWFPNDCHYPISLPQDLLKQAGRDETLFVPPPFQNRFFHFTSESIGKLKAKANAKSGLYSSASGDKISSLQAVLAHSWIAVMRAKRVDPNEETSHTVVMGNRSKLKPPLPEEYFGNSVGGDVATAKVGELLERGIGFGAFLLNQVVKSHNDESIRSSWKSWLERPIFISMNSRKSYINALTTSSSPRFNMYGNDFGWGRPIAVRTGSNGKIDGDLRVHPGSVEGSIDVEVCLSIETMKALEEDAEFMEVVTLPHFQNVNYSSSSPYCSRHLNKSVCVS